MITHFTQFVDEESAKAALPSYWYGDNTSWSWNRSIVDGPITVLANDGNGDPVIAYFLNIAKDTLDTSLPGLTGAGHRDPVTKVWVKDYGTNPVTPQREFA